MDKVPANLLNPDARFKIRADTAQAVLPTVSDFWRWAFSNLADNTVRGVLAEFIVGTALGIRFDEPRGAWEDCDLIAPDGARIEVKATGYLQAWDSRGAPPTFSRLRGQKLTEDKAAYKGKAVVRSHVFVFCIQTAKHADRYDHLDFSQWGFWVVPGAKIDGMKQKSIRLSAVKK